MAYRRGAAGILTPVVRGTGIRVQTIVTAARDWGMATGEIAREFGLTEQQVDACLAFYRAQPDEIDASIRADEDLSAAHA